MLFSQPVNLTQIMHNRTADCLAAIAASLINTYNKTSVFAHNCFIKCMALKLHHQLKHD